MDSFAKNWTGKHDCSRTYVLLRASPVEFWSRKMCRKTTTTGETRHECGQQPENPQMDRLKTHEDHGQVSTILRTSQH